MRRLDLALLVAVLASVGCDGGGKDLQINPGDDTGDTEDSDTGETGETDDTDTGETGDSETGDTEDTDTGETGDTDTGETGDAEELVHCGEIVGDQTWRAGFGDHFVDCNVDVKNGVLTIEAGAVVRFDNGAGIRVATDEQTGGLRVLGTASAPVLFAPEASGAEPVVGYWAGIDVSTYASEVELSHLTIDGAGSSAYPSLRVDRLAVAVTEVTVRNSGNTAIVFEEGARFAAGSSGVVVEGAEEYPLQIGAGEVTTIPGVGSSFTGNGIDAILVEGGTVDVPSRWEDRGLDYVIGATVYLEGDAADPAILTLGPGVRLAFELGRGLILSQDGGASGLVTEGTAADPVVFTASGAGVPGYWDGIAAFEGVPDGALSLSYTTIEWGGDNYRASLYLDSASAVLDHVTIRGSSEAGLRLFESAELLPGSGGNVITGGEDAPLYVNAAAIGTIQGAFDDLTGNADDTVHIGPDNDDLTTSVTLADLGVPYWVDDDILVEGTADAPAILTVAAGVELLFDTSTGLFIAKNGGPAGLVAVGTESAPIAFAPAASSTPGTWDGVGLYGSCIDEQSLLEHVDIGYGGGPQLRGNLHVYSCNPTVDATHLHDSDEYGLYLDGDASPVLGAVTYADNASGDSNL